MEGVIRKRIYSFDLLKLFSILIVFFYHILMDMYVIHPMHNLKFLETILIRPNIHLAMLACGIFIFISGATLKLNERDESLLSFYKRRLVKILIPFYFAYIIYFIIKAITLRNIHLFGGIEKWRFIYTIFGIDEYLNAAGIKTFTLGIGEWFLGCIILCYLIYPVLSYLDKKYKVATFVTFTIYDILINVFYSRFNFAMPQHFNFLCQAYNFYLGIVIIDENIFSKLKKYQILGILLVLFIYFCPYTFNIPDNLKITLCTISIVVAFRSLENVLVKNDFMIAIIKKFNAISLEFFLVHHFVIYEVDYILNYRRVGGMEFLIIVFIELIIIILISIWINKLNQLCYQFMNKCHN